MTVYLVTSLHHVHTPYMTAYLVISLPNNHNYTVYVWFWPTLRMHVLEASLPTLFISAAYHCVRVCVCVCVCVCVEQGVSTLYSTSRAYSKAVQTFCMSPPLYINARVKPPCVRV